MEFNELKQDVLDRAKKCRACQPEYKRAYSSESKRELLQVIVDNLIWAYKEKMLDTQYMIEHFSDLFEEFGIYTTGQHEFKDKSVTLLGSSSATIETWGSSSADYELKGDYSTIKDLNKLKLFVKKSKFEIVEVE